MNLISTATTVTTFINANTCNPQRATHRGNYVFFKILKVIQAIITEYLISDIFIYTQSGARPQHIIRQFLTDDCGYWQLPDRPRMPQILRSLQLRSCEDCQLILYKDDRIITVSVPLEYINNRTTIMDRRAFCSAECVEMKIHRFNHNYRAVTKNFYGRCPNCKSMIFDIENAWKETAHELNFAIISHRHFCDIKCMLQFYTG